MPVDSSIDAHAIKARIAAAYIDGGEVGECCTAARQGIARPIKKPDTERFGHASAAIVDAAVTTAEQDAARTPIESGAHQFADAVARRQAGIALVARDEAETGGCGHLDHGGRFVAAAEEAEMCFGRVVDGAGHGQVVERAVGCLDEGLGETLAAVDHWRFDDCNAGKSAQDATFDAIRCLIDRQALFETGGGDENRERHRVFLFYDNDVTVKERGGAKSIPRN